MNIDRPAAIRAICDAALRTCGDPLEGAGACTVAALNLLRDTGLSAWESIEAMQRIVDRLVPLEWGPQ